MRKEDDAREKMKEKNCNMTCGSHILGEIIGDLLEHLPNSLKKLYWRSPIQSYWG